MAIAARAQLHTSSELARTASKSISTSSAELVAAQLDTASHAIAAGENLTAQNDTPAALGAFQSALRATEKLGVFLQTSSDIHARTGLVVSEPKTSTSDKTSRIATSEGARSAKNTSGEQPRRAAVMMKAATAPAPAAALFSATEPAATTTATSTPEDLSGATVTASSSLETLPVSVPMNGFQ